MALTYRVSFKTIAKMFYTTVLDVIETFRYLDSNYPCLDYLFLETLNEDENMEKIAEYNARIYMKKRNTINKSIKDSKGDKNRIQELKHELKELHLEIDDTKVFQTIEKTWQSLTQEERDLIARYPLKYHISIKESSRRLKRDTRLINQYIEDLASRNIIFQEKFALHAQEFREINYSVYQKQELFTQTHTRGGI